MAPMVKRIRPAKEPVIRILQPGQCEANCTKATCPHGIQLIEQFAPTVSNITHKKRAAFDKIVKAINAINDVLNDPECMKLINEARLLRTKTCLQCRIIEKRTQENPTTKRGKCRTKWFELRAKMEEQGCILCGCTDNMSVEHTDPEEKMRDAKGQPVCLGEYTKWIVLGGPEAMQAEFDKPSIVPMCLNCQYMQPTGYAMQPKLDPKDLPDGKQRGTKEEQAAYTKKRNLTRRQEKQDYVNKKKLAIGQCAECCYTVVRHGSVWSPGYTGYPHAFAFAHRSELDKEAGVSTIVGSCHTFKKCKPLLDKEMARCRLLCMCCNKTETDARKHAPGPSEEMDEETIDESGADSTDDESE